VIREELEKTGQVSELVTGLAFLAATKVRPELPRSAREWRLLRAVINHDYLRRTVGVDPARNLYGYLENLLAWDHHYWLQRGSFEVEVGDLDLAENFLNSAKSLGPQNDPFIENERAYLAFSKAIAAPTTQVAKELVSESDGDLGVPDFQDRRPGLVSVPRPGQSRFGMGTQRHCFVAGTRALLAQPDLPG
jgi:hypothetical protein